MRIHDPKLSISALLISAFLVRKYKSDGPWSESFTWAIKLSVAVIAFRVLVGIIIGVPVPGHNLITLPQIPLPHWMAGITLGGPVTWERVSSAAIESLNIATIIALFGAATSLTNPRAVLKSIPPIFYEVGMILVIATTLTPQLVGNLKRIKTAQQLRGISANRLLAWRQIAMPLLEDSLARALDLAAAMDSRGYGQSRKRSKYRPNSFTLSDGLFVLTAIGFLAVSL